MRLDYFLKVSRLVKRRPLANEMCDKHLVQVNEHVAKAGREVNAGDIVSVTFRNRRITVRVEAIPEHAVSKKEAPALYILLEELQIHEEDMLC